MYLNERIETVLQQIIDHNKMGKRRSVVPEVIIVQVLRKRHFRFKLSETIILLDTCSSRVVAKISCIFDF